MALNPISFALNKVVKIISSIFFGLLYICITGMMMLIVIDTMLRFIFGSDIKGATEISTYILALIGFIGLTLTHAVKQHITVSFLVEKFSPPVRYFIGQANHLILLFLCFLFIYAGTQRALSAFTDRETNWFGPHLWPVWFFRFIVPISFGFLIFQLLVDILETRADYQKSVLCQTTKQSGEDKK